MSHSKRRFEVGDIVTILRIGCQCPFCIIKADNNSGRYDIASLDDVYRGSVNRKEITKFFYSGDRVVDNLGRYGTVVAQKLGQNYADVLFDEPSGRQLFKPHHYERLGDRGFVTCMEVNQLTKVPSCDTINAQEIEFSEDEFLELIGGV